MTLLEKSLSDWIKKYIQHRTLYLHRDWQDQPFVPYTPAYAKQKGVPRSEVDLWLSGEMMSDFEVEVKLTKKPFDKANRILNIDLAEMIFRMPDSVAQKFEWNKDRGAFSRNPFFDPNSDEMPFNQEQIDVIVEALLNEDTADL